MTTDLVSVAALDRAANLLHAHIGLRPESTLRPRLHRCVRDEARSLGQAPDTYVDALSRQPERLQRLVNRMTIQESGFFRHPEQFDVLAEHILPGLDRPARIWSAGCANGQEAYSLAMLLTERRVDGTVLATDMSTTALRRAESARFAARELAGLSAQRVARHLVPTGKFWQVDDDVRARVTVDGHNLLDPLPERVRNGDIVFCRNVLIYLSAGHARRFLDRVADALGETGYLFIGAAETLWQVSDRFDALRIGDTYIYRPRRAASLVEPATPAAQTEARDARAVRPASRVPAAPPAAPLRTADASAEVLAADGHRAQSTGSSGAAIEAYRKWAYLEPDEVVAHLHLALALEAAGDQTAARRAFGAARRLVGTADPVELAAAIEGYTVEELVRMLDVKISSRAPE